MIADDTEIVLNTMKAMWPQHTLTAEQIALWAHHLGPLDYEDAMAVLAMLERTQRFWPHWSQFLDVHQPLIRRRLEANDRALSASHERPCTPAEAAVHLARCREILANAKGPLANGLRSTVRTATVGSAAAPPKLPEDPIERARHQGINLGDTSRADAQLLAGTIELPAARQAFLAGWESAQGGGS